jgi:hypothetical protein
LICFGIATAEDADNKAFQASHLQLLKDTKYIFQTMASTFQDYKSEKKELLKAKAQLADKLLKMEAAAIKKASKQQETSAKRERTEAAKEAARTGTDDADAAAADPETSGQKRLRMSGLDEADPSVLKSLAKFPLSMRVPVAATELACHP